MIRAAVRSAWTMLLRPTVVWPAALAVIAFSVIVVSITFTTAAAPGGSRLTDPPTTLADLAGSGALVQIIGRPIMVLGTVVLATSILHMSGQFSSGLVRVLFVQQPRRGVWLVGNWLALATTAVLGSIVAAVVAVGTGLVCAAVWGVDIAAWDDGVNGAIAATANLALAMTAFALAGSFLAVWLRSPITALTVGLVYALFESMIGAALPLVDGILPASAFTTVATSGLNGSPYLPSLVATGVIVAGVLLAGYLIVKNRDVVD